ncbi:hypothetical protein P8605_19195 [Streptomyces sp. T-3]|nr:hypothetical protein [Streptomyces sp. T-3]
MGDNIVRKALVVLAGVLALLLLLAMWGGGKDKKDEGAEEGGKPGGGPSEQSQAKGGPDTRLEVPAAYDTAEGWEISGVSEQFAVAQAAGRIAYAERVGKDRFRIRAVDARTGRRSWQGEPWRPLADRPAGFPRLVALAKDGRQYFATWSYGKFAADPLSEADRIVSLDLYDAADGTRQRVELPWPEAPAVSGSGPGLLIGKGTTRAAVIDPVTGRTAKYGPADLAYPKGCANCRRLTEIRALTSKGLLISGAGEFWVPGAWHARKVAPKGTDPGSGTPTSVTGDRVLAKWSKKKGGKGAAGFDTWAVHDAVDGKVLASVECHKPAIEPGRYPDAVLSPGGRYLVAGNLAFDLEEKAGHCFEEDGVAKSLTLATVTDQGVAYGATGARGAADALSGGGTPVEVPLDTAEPKALSPSLRLPAYDLGETGIFRWEDGKDVQHLTGYARRP